MENKDAIAAKSHFPVSAGNVRFRQKIAENGRKRKVLVGFSRFVRETLGFGKFQHVCAGNCMKQRVSVSFGTFRTVYARLCSI